MAYRPSSSRAGGRRRSGSSARGASRARGTARDAGGSGRSYGRSPRQGNPAAVISAFVIVAGVIAIIVVVSSGKDNGSRTSRPPSSRPAASSPASTGGDAAAESTRMREPEMPPALRTEAMELVKSFEDLAAQGNALYQEALTAHEAGDEELYQEKLRQASLVFNEIQDAWNDLIMRMPTNADWNEEEVANHYLGREQEKVTRYLKFLKEIRGQRVTGNGDGTR